MSHERKAAGLIQNRDRADDADDTMRPMQLKNRPYGLLPSGWLFRWLVYAATVGLLWSLVAQVMLGGGTRRSLVQGALFGVFFATVAVWRETRGARRRLRRK